MTAGSGIKFMPQNQQLAEELHKAIVKNSTKSKAY